MQAYAKYYVEVASHNTTKYTAGSSKCGNDVRGTLGRSLPVPSVGMPTLPFPLEKSLLAKPGHLRPETPIKGRAVLVQERKTQ